MKIPRRAMRVLPHVERHVTLLTRKTVNDSQTFTRFRTAVQEAAAKHFQSLRST